MSRNKDSLGERQLEALIRRALKREEARRREETAPEGGFEPTRRQKQRAYKLYAEKLRAEREESEYAQKRPVSGLFRLTAALAEFFSAPDERAADRSAAHTRMIWEICDRIHRSAAAIPTLAETAREYGYSSDYLGRLFHQVCGVSYSAYAANTRINLAKTMLTETERSLGEIAEALGYYDTAYFCRQFRQLTGTAPGKFRRGRN